MLNPIFKRISEIETNQRRKRRDKKHDIKIPVTQDVDNALKSRGRMLRMSKSAYTTQLLEKAFIRNYDFPEIEYEDSAYTTHAKVNHELYLQIGVYADRWGYSIRRSAHRMVIEMLRLDFGGESK